MFDLIVVGGGPGGYEAAAHAGKLGMSVALVEKKRLGGTCLNVGCIPAKTFLHTAKLVRDAREGAAYGVQVGTPTVDQPTLVARKNRIVDTLVNGVGQLMDANKVQVVQGEGRLVARDTVEVRTGEGTERLQAANVMIATGSKVAKPPIPGLDSPAVLDSDSVFDLPELPASVAIIGGGVIGLEFASFFNDVGVQVTVLEMLPSIGAGADDDVSRRLLKALQSAGITFHLSAKVTEVGPDGVRFTDAKGTEQVVVAERVMNAAGRVPAVAGLGLEELGVEVRRGVVTTPEGRTNVPGIWAIGDANGRMMLAHVATREGIVAVNTIAGRPDRMRYDAMPGVIYTSPEASWVGPTEAQLKQAGVAYRKAQVPAGVSGRFLIENEHGSGFAKVLVDARYGRLLGAHVLGDVSSEFIVAAAAMIETELTAEAAMEVVFPHPTVSEVLREALVRVAHV
ncbi:dihydrolipoyl dehydrogenase [Actinotalea sp. M2MS4P-6]|uniref:dihydrolipoyl dehydrogenase n=1 Tax=Actinotalea sp. M2MS4P-6 TaxID=2983762 RepID=UPI0021E4E4C4|nr:dihydrolipoyl dehydrogenase [Actinotalea sp. M2MS4P-6]MCV2394190.1 dihydrolipoyl dehydrogenase [Actinotalea sp. M2MS4P-6]